MLSEVEFHTGVADPAGYACRLLRKACRSVAGLHALVTAPAALLGDVDRQLWTFDDRDFVAHARWPGAARAVASRSPIWLLAAEDAAAAVAAARNMRNTRDTRDAAAAPGAPPTLLLLNLGSVVNAEPAALDRLIEIVGTDPQDAAAARVRWRDYKAAGLAVRHHARAA